MPEPRPFLPPWVAVTPERTRSGCGLLDKDSAPHRNLLDEFRVILPGVMVSVRPRSGEMFLNNKQVAKLGPSELVWFRKMEMEIGTHDRNGSAASCLWYGLGLQRQGQRFGFRVMADGRLAEGLPE